MALTGIASSKMKEAIRLACMASHRDWLSELSIFQPPPFPGPTPAEDWSMDCWIHLLDSSNDRRSVLLDRATPSHFEQDAILVSDGGEHPYHGCTYAAEVRTLVPMRNITNPPTLSVLQSLDAYPLGMDTKFATSTPLKS